MLHTGQYLDTVPLKPQNNPVYYSHFIEGTGGFEKVYNLPKVNPLVNDRS